VKEKKILKKKEEKNDKEIAIENLRLKGYTGRKRSRR
jgi:hypothetical protein